MKKDTISEKADKRFRLPENGVFGVLVIRDGSVLWTKISLQKMRKIGDIDGNQVGLNIGFSWA